MRKILCVIVILFNTMVVNASFWAAVQEDVLVPFHEVIGDRYLKQKECQKAKESYLKAIKYSQTQKKSGELYLKIAETYFVRAKIDSKKEILFISLAIDNVLRAKKLSRIFTDEMLDKQNSFVSMGRKVLDSKREFTNRRYYKLASGIYDLTEDDFDYLKLIQTKYQLGMCSFEEFKSLLILNSKDQQYKVRREKLYSSLIENAIRTNNFKIISALEKELEESKWFKQKTDELILSYFLQDLTKFSLKSKNTSDLYKVFLRLENSKKNLVDRGVYNHKYDSNISELLDYLLMVLLEKDFNNFCLISSKYEIKRDKLERMVVDHYSKVETSDFPKFKLLYWYRKEYQLENILSLSKTDRAKAIKLVQELVSDKITAQNKEFRLAYLQIRENVSSSLDHDLEEQLNKKRWAAAAKLLTKYQAVRCFPSKKNMNRIRKIYLGLIMNLNREEQYSYTYNFYTLLSRYFEFDEEIRSSKKILIQNDWTQNYISSILKAEDRDWTGDFNDCSCGKMPDSFYTKKQREFAFYRRLAELPDQIIFVEEYNNLAQEAALVNSFNVLTHHPTPEMKCYSEAAFLGSSHSNLSSAIRIRGYMEDYGANNKSVGHRRWMLNPYNLHFGIGATFHQTTKKREYTTTTWTQQGGALYVISDEVNDDLLKDYTQEGTGWPMAGYFPTQFTYERWSYSLDRADFSNAKVRLTDANGKTITPLTYKPKYGYALNTIVWEYEYGEILPEYIEVVISGVIKNGEENFSEITYKVYPFSLTPVLLAGE